MNNKITFPALVALVALKSGLTKEKSEEFLKEFFRLIAEALREGESVKIKTLGTFKLVSVETRRSVNVTNGEEILIPGHNRIVFVPSKELADAVNAPFSMFESVEVHPDAEAELEGREEFSQQVPAPIAEETAFSEKLTVREPAEPISPVLPTEHITPAEPITPTEPVTPSEPITPTERITPTEPITPTESITPTEPLTPTEPTSPTEIEPVEEGRKSGKGKFIWGLLCGILLALLIIGIAYFFIQRKLTKPMVEENPVEDSIVINEAELDTVEFVMNAGESYMDDSDNIEPEPEPVMTEEIAATEPSDKEEKSAPKKVENSEAKTITDVIGPHNYLTTMAQKHYGDYNLWPYIYEENKKFLGHPDRIKPGTKVVVPPLSKYGVDPKNPADIRKAKNLGVKIYAKYK